MKLIIIIKKNKIVKKKKKEVLDIITKELDNQLNINYKQRCEIINEKLKITSDIKFVIEFIGEQYNYDFSSNLKFLFETNIWNILENKKLDKDNIVSGKKFLENYINLFYPELKEIYSKFIDHYLIVKEIYLSGN